MGYKGDSRVTIYLQPPPFYMHYMIYRTKCKVYITKNNKYITLCEKDYYVWVNSKLRIPFVTQDSLFVNESPVL